MAVTSIWPIKGRVKAVIDYANDPSKVKASSQVEQAALHAVNGVLEYAANDLKTELRVYAHGINCSLGKAAEDFMSTKQFWEKTGGRTAYHGYQSFRAGEVTAEQAHEIGMELARRLWGDRFEVVVATHLNTGHFHNHFVINSVSFQDGGRFYNSKEDYKQLRAMSDQICREHGLSVIDRPQGKKKDYGEWAAEQADRPTRRSLIREDIDRAIALSVSSRDFVRALEAMGYELKLSGVKYPGLKPPGAKGFFRFHKLGEDYTPDVIRERILEKKVRDTPSPVARLPPRTVRFRGSLYKARKLTGLRALYFRYCCELRILVKRPSSVRKMHFLLREDIAKLDALAAQSRLLCRTRITTADQLQAYTEHLEAEISDLARQREALRKALRTQNPKSKETKAAIADLTARIRALRKEVNTCKAIETRSKQIAENLRLLCEEKNETRKEMEEREHIRRERRSGREDVPAWS